MECLTFIISPELQQQGPTRLVLNHMLCHYMLLQQETLIIDKRNKDNNKM